MIYRLDLRKPDGLFHARQMLVRNKDIIYVANAEAAELRKFLDLIGTSFGTVSAGASIAN